MHKRTGCCDVAKHQIVQGSNHATEWLSEAIRKRAKRLPWAEITGIRMPITEAETNSRRTIWPFMSTFISGLSKKPERLGRCKGCIKSKLVEIDKFRL